jgi:hypothetical protein
MALTWAAAPQRSQRSTAVSSGRVSVGVVIGVPPSRHRLPGAIDPATTTSAMTPVTGSPPAPRCSLPLLLQTFPVPQVFPRPWDPCHVELPHMPQINPARRDPGPGRSDFP